MPRYNGDLSGAGNSNSPLIYEPGESRKYLQFPYTSTQYHQQHNSTQMEFRAEKQYTYLILSLAIHDQG